MIISVGNQKGGVGKSTLVVNLGVAYKKAGKEVILVESDPSVRTVSNWKDDRSELNVPQLPVVRQTGKLKSLLSDLSTKYDVVLVDLPGKDSVEMRTALTVTDLFVMPTQPTQPDIDATLDMTDLILTAEDFNDKLKTAVVINRAKTWAWDTAADDTREILGETYENVCKTILHDRKAFFSTLSQGLSAVESADRKARQEVEELAEQMEGLINDHE